MPNTVVLLAITGAQQSAIAVRFTEAGWTVRGTSRKAASTAHGLTLVADLDTDEGLEATLRGADVAVLTLPQDHRAGIGRLVLNAAGTIDERSEGALFVDMRAARQAVSEGGAPFVVLQPTVFMDNLLAPWSLPGIVEHGILAYPAPERARISWLSHRSLADYVYAAATAPEAAGRDLRIGGPEALAGDQLCARLGERLGRTIRYQRIPLEGFAAGLDQAFGPPAGQRIASLYARLDDEPAVMAVDPASSAFLGVTPESFVAFAARHSWSGQLR
jgi:NAD(P)H dehydrogenase (quinone)